MIGDLIGEWIKGILIDGIMGNLSGLFNTVNTKVGEIASDVGSTPQDWNGGIFSMLQNLSETVIVPIAAAILALVMCYELIDMIVEKNNMHDFDSSMFFRWIFKSAFAILIVTNTWNIVMGVFDATQQVVNQSAGVIIGDMLFEKQYILTQTIETETRYRTETRTDSEGNTYTVEVPYTYYICNVKLENFDLSHLPIYILTEEQMGFYAAYMQTLGNRPDLFPNGSYPHASTPKEPTYYEIPPEALKDEAFAAMIAEAEKYVGYPYVWGGSSPSTSFDCSGFISWVINHSGWNVGRQTAQGLYNICTPVSPEQAKPGDLVFFVGTYDTAGMSHVGLYVGNSVMLHCGDPISYTNLNSSYWQQHFYCYGRLP